MDNTFTGLCILLVLFVNFDNAEYDLYDVIMRALLQ